MTSKSSRPVTAAKKKLLAQLAAAQKHADAARKESKLAKLALRSAKQDFKDARRAAKKLRKAVKSLKAELAAFTVKRSRRNRAAMKRSLKSILPITPPVVALAPTENPPTEIYLPPVAPTT